MDITALTDMAKEQMLADGDYTPMLYVETDDSTMTMIAFADFPYQKTTEKQRAFFGLGMKLAKETPGKSLKQLIFICESRTSFQELDEPRKYAAPSQDPNRGEALCCQILDVVPAPDKPVLKQSMRLYDIIRTGGGIDLLAHGDVGEVHGYILPYFVSGFIAGQMPDEELAKIVASVVDRPV